LTTVRWPTGGCRRCWQGMLPPSASYTRCAPSPSRWHALTSSIPTRINRERPQKSSRQLARSNRPARQVDNCLDGRCPCRSTARVLLWERTLRLRQAARQHGIGLFGALGRHPVLGVGNSPAINLIILQCLDFRHRRLAVELLDSIRERLSLRRRDCRWDSGTVTLKSTAL
jgi:hypothetical protein